MADSRKISVAIPNYNRYEFVIDAMEGVLEDERIDEIVISDDASTDGCAELLAAYYRSEDKVTIHKNLFNIDCYRNKHHAVSHVSNEWVALIDSDNKISTDYIDRIFEIQKWDENIIYAPTFAMPQFDYRAFGGHTISQHNVADYMNQNMFSTALNTFNFFINRNSYLSVWDGKIDPVTADSIYFNYCWLKSGKKIHFVEGLQYFHRVHDGSHYQLNQKRTPNNLLSEIETKLKQLS